MIKEEKKISKILKKRKNIQKSSSSELDRNAFSKQCIATPISSEDHDASNKMKHKKTNRNLTESHFSDVLVSPTKPNSKYSFPIVSSSSSSSDKNLEVLEKQKPTQTLNSLSETVENAIVKLKEIAVKSDFTKKKFPKELDAALYQVCFLAHKEVGFLSSHLMERLCSILPFKKNTLKTRFGKLNTLDTRAAKYQQIIEENIEKLKTKISTQLAVCHADQSEPRELNFLWDPEAEEYLWTLYRNRLELERTLLDKRSLEGNLETGEPSLESNLSNYMTKLCELWPLGCMNYRSLENIIKKIKLQKKKEKESAKQISSGSKKINPMPIIAEKEVKMKEELSSLVPIEIPLKREDNLLQSFHFPSQTAIITTTTNNNNNNNNFNNAIDNSQKEERSSQQK